MLPYLNPRFQTSASDPFFRKTVWTLNSLSLCGVSGVDPAKIAQFNCLIQEAIGCHPRRHVVVPWELAILLDIESCSVRQSSREDLLRRYQRAAYQHAAAGKPELLKFPEFLQQVRRKGNLPKAAAATGLSSN